MSLVAQVDEKLNSELDKDLKSVDKADHAYRALQLQVAQGLAGLNAGASNLEAQVPAEHGPMLTKIKEVLQTAADVKDSMDASSKVRNAVSTSEDPSETEDSNGGQNGDEDTSESATTVEIGSATSTSSEASEDPSETEDNSGGQNGDEDTSEEPTTAEVGSATSTSGEASEDRSETEDNNAGQTGNEDTSEDTTTAEVGSPTTTSGATFVPLSVTDQDFGDDCPREQISGYKLLFKGSWSGKMEIAIRSSLEHCAALCNSDANCIRFSLQMEAGRSGVCSHYTHAGEPSHSDRCSYAFEKATLSAKEKHKLHAEEEEDNVEKKGEQDVSMRASASPNFVVGSTPKTSPKDGASNTVPEPSVAEQEESVAKHEAMASKRKVAAEILPDPSEWDPSGYRGKPPGKQVLRLKVKHLHKMSMTSSRGAF